MTAPDVDVQVESSIRSDTLIQTNRGLLRLSEIGDINGHSCQNIDRVSVVTEVNSLAPVKRFYVNGHAATRKFVTRDGIILECTLEHKFRIIRINGDDISYIWKSAKNIVSGDALAVKYGGYRSNPLPHRFESIEHTDTPESKLPISFPEYLSAKLAWLIGVIIGYGHVRYNLKESRHDIFLYDLSASTIERVRDFIKGEFNIDLIIINRDIFKIPDLLSRWLIKNNCMVYNGIPLCIRQGAINYIHSFISGFMSGRRAPSSLSPILKSEFISLCRAVCNTAGNIFYSDGKLYSDGNYLLRICNDHDSSNRRVLGFWMDHILTVTDSSCNTCDIEVDEIHHYRASGVISSSSVSIYPDSASK